MKYLKTFGLAAVATMALMIFLGVNTSSATVLCRTTSTPCGKEWHYSTGTEIHASLKPGTVMVIKSNVIIAECSESTIASRTANTGSGTETVNGNVERAKVTWGRCTFEKMETVKGGQLEIHWIAGTDSATVTAKEIEVTVKSTGLSCTYGAGEGIDFGTLTGGNPATISMRATVFVTGGFACPATTTWEAEYVVTAPIPLYIEKE